MAHRARALALHTRAQVQSLMPHGPPEHCRIDSWVLLDDILLVYANSDYYLLSSPDPSNLFFFSSADTKGLYFQAFGGRRRCLSKSVAPLLAHGYRRFLPTKDHVFILDYAGTLFFLKNALVSSTLGQIQWKRACRYVVLCRGAKDVSSNRILAGVNLPSLYPWPSSPASLNRNQELASLRVPPGVVE